MSITYTESLYPTVGNPKPKNLSAVADLTSEFMKSVVTYLEGQGIHDATMVKLPGLSKAADMIKKAKKEAGKNELAVRGGINGKGELVVSVNGILPPAKSGGKPTPYEKFEVVRAGFETLVTEMKSQSNVVVNMTKESGTKGDDIINRASEKQAKKFGTTAQNDDESDFGGITTGNVVLCAHGGAAVVSGTVVGDSLGERTAAQIVEFLSQNPNKAKRLSKDFTGTVLLSGCFTASGNAAIPTFAGEVLRNLKSAGYTKCAVKGMPGPSVTRESGDKAARHGMKTEEGAQALAQQTQKLKVRFEEVEKELEDIRQKRAANKLKLEEMKGKLKEMEYKQMEEKWKASEEKTKDIFDNIVHNWREVLKEHSSVVSEQDSLGMAKNRIEKLVGTFGAQGR